MASAYAAFFLSGATALLFEGVWLRRMTLVLGSSPAAFALVSSTIILGLGVGALIHFRGYTARGSHPLRIPAVVQAVFSTSSLLFLQGGFAGVPSLLLCSLLSGMAIASFVSAWGRIGGGSPRQNGMLFGINFVGGSIGIVAVGFLLIPVLGMKRGTVCAFLLGILTVFLYEFAGRRLMEEFSGSGVEVPGRRAGFGTGTLLPALLVAMTGWTGFGLEILWGRWISQMAGSSVYTYYCILAVAVSAFGAGCLAASGIRARDPDHASGRVGALFVTCSVLYPVLALGGLLFLEGSGSTLFHLVGLFGMTLPVSTVLVTVLLVFPPLFGSGAFFSLVLDGGASPGPPDFRACFLANCIGSAAAGAGIPLLLIPAAGMGGALVLLSLLNLVPAYLLMRRAGAMGGVLRHRSIVLLLSLAILLLSGAAVFRRPVNFLLPRSLHALGKDPGNASNIAIPGPVPGYYREGPFSTVLVTGEGNNRVLIVDGKPESNAVRDRATQTMLAHLPFLVRGEVFDKVLLIGLGSGSTLGGILAHPVSRVDCVEISEGVVDAVRKGFGADDGRAIRDPRVRVTVEDGRKTLRKKGVPYDLIVSQPSNPWVLGASSLFTRDAFLEMASALTSSGVAVVWFQTYGVRAEEVALERDTIRSVFPHVIVFSFMPGDLIFLCSREPMNLDLPALQERIVVAPAVMGQLLGVGVRNPVDLLGGFFGGITDPGNGVPMTTGIRWNTDDRPVLEYALARSVSERDPYGPYAMVLAPLEDRIACIAGVPSTGSGPLGMFLMEWGETACRRGFCRFSEPLFHGAMQKRGRDARVLNDLGIVRFDQNDYNGARNYFQDSLSIDPHYGPARENLERLAGGGYGTDQEMDRFR